MTGDNYLVSYLSKIIIVIQRRKGEIDSCQISYLSKLLSSSSIDIIVVVNQPSKCEYKDDDKTLYDQNVLSLYPAKKNYHYSCKQKQ